MKIIKQLKAPGLTTKFNLLSIMLVLITAIAVTTYAVKREWDNQIENLVEDGRLNYLQSLVNTLFIPEILRA